MVTTQGLTVTHQAAGRATSQAAMPAGTPFRSQSLPTGSNSITVRCLGSASQGKHYRAASNSAVEVAYRHHRLSTIPTSTTPATVSASASQQARTLTSTTGIRKARPPRNQATGHATPGQLARAGLIKTRFHRSLIGGIFE